MNAQAPSAKINNTWYEYDKMLNDRKGMDIHIDFNVNNMKGQEVKASVIFYDYNKEGLKNPYAEKKYLLKGNTLCVQHIVTATYTSSHWKDLCIFMPYDQFPHGNGKNTYYYNNSYYFKYHKLIIIKYMYMGMANGFPAILITSKSVSHGGDRISRQAV